MERDNLRHSDIEIEKARKGKQRPQKDSGEGSNPSILPGKAAEAKKQINAIIREGNELTWWNLTDILGCKKLAHLYLLMIELKEDLMQSMIVTDSPKAYINDEQIVGEGFVLKNDKMILKLVEREVFAFNNFNLQKSWS